MAELDYPDFEVILVDDGSTDASAAIASEYDVTVISTPNCGLSAARTLGAERASGEIVAYIDDDARPDRDWLRYLAWTYLTTDHAMVGGPNIAPAGDGPLAFCVANAPGGPVHVLLTDEIAEHVPGCNLSARRERLLEIGGFDPRFRAAGDDVDFCWRIQNRAGRWDSSGSDGLASPPQFAEDLLETAAGLWQGGGAAGSEMARAIQRHGSYFVGRALVWQRLDPRAGKPRRADVSRRLGAGAFQALYDQNPPLLALLPLMPEWWLVIAALALISLLGLAWTPLLLALPLLVVALGADQWRRRGSAHGSCRTRREQSVPNEPGCGRSPPDCIWCNRLPDCGVVWRMGFPHGVVAARGRLGCRCRAP